MKSITSDNFRKMHRLGKYRETFNFLTSTLPKEFRKRGINLVVKVGGEDYTDLKFFHKIDDYTEKDITHIVEKVILGKEIQTKNEETQELVL